MEDTQTEILQLSDIAIEAYITSDMDFVATLKATDNVPLKILQLVPFNYGGYSEGKATRLMMHLCFHDDTGNPVPAVSKLEELRISYLNGELRVDPVTLFSHVRTLRSMYAEKQSAVHRISRKKIDAASKRHVEKEGAV